MLTNKERFISILSINQFRYTPRPKITHYQREIGKFTVTVLLENEKFTISIINYNNTTLLPNFVFKYDDNMKSNFDTIINFLRKN